MRTAASNFRPTQLEGFEHRMAVGADSSSIHYVIGGRGPPLFLVHGFPQNWYEWRLVMPALAQQNQVIAVDLRGAGYSEAGSGSFSKMAMALDLQILSEQLGFSEVQVIGHDVGAMVAFAWAARSPNMVSRLVLVEALIPGGSYWTKVLALPLAWHIGFHASPGFPELLIAGKEFEYLEKFMRHHAFNQGAFSREDLRYFADMYSRGDALRSAMGWYRAMAQDAVDNEKVLAEKLKMPVLAIGADRGVASMMLEMAGEFANDVRIRIIQNCGHWVPEEDPGAFVEALRTFVVGRSVEHRTA